MLSGAMIIGDNNQMMWLPSNVVLAWLVVPLVAV
jgi:hypothetical protein